MYSLLKFPNFSYIKVCLFYVKYENTVKINYILKRYNFIKKL